MQLCIISAASGYSVPVKSVCCHASWCLQNKNKSSAKKIQKPLPLGGVESTGHAASPATIVIGHKKRRSRPESSGSMFLQVFYCHFCPVDFRISALTTLLMI